MSGQAFSKDPFMLEYCLDRDIRHKKLGIKLLIIFYQHQNLFLIRLLQIKWLKKPLCFIHRWDIHFFVEYSSNATFSSNEMGILSADLNNINLEEVNFYEDHPKTIINVRLLAWHNKLTTMQNI